MLIDMACYRYWFVSSEADMKGLTFPGTLTYLSFSLLSLCLNSSRLYGQDSRQLEFDESFLQTGEKESIDLGRFSYGSAAFPGRWETRIYLNNELIQIQEVSFVTSADSKVRPCLTADLISVLPLNQTKLPNGLFEDASERCMEIPAFIPDARVYFDSSEQSLHIEVPQVWVNRLARGTVPPSSWDNGVPAMLIGYNVNGYQSNSAGHTWKSVYAGLTGGLNMGSWYLRHNGSWRWDEQNSAHYQSINTYLQRDIAQIKGRLHVGQPNTSGRLFDTLSLSGVTLESDERMQPQSRRGYAPEIRGIARTSSQVTIRQNGNLLYETTVSPGEFVIDDLYPTGYGGDLDVTIREADGSEQNFQVPYSSVVQQLRAGVSRYEFAMGELRSNYLRRSPPLTQASWQYGLNNTLSLYGGAQGSEHYMSGQAGGSVALPLGAISLDVTHARSELGHDVTRTGESYRISYNKNVTETRSNFSLAAYRFSTHGYMDLLTAMQAREYLSDGESVERLRRTKSRYSLTASQGLPSGWGQFYLSTSLQNYWNAGGIDKQYQIGYNNRWQKLIWGVSANRSYSATGTSRDSFMLNMSIPLGSDFRSPVGRLNYVSSSGGQYSWQAGVSGTAGEESEFGYGVSGTSANKGSGSSGAANGSWRTSFTSLSGSYSSGRHYHSASAGASGTLIAHEGGVTLSAYQGETFALVEAKGAHGAKVSGYNGVVVDRLGYAVVPHLNPYQMNNVAIDLQGTESGVELENTSQQVAPRDKAVVKMRYQTRSGRPLLISVSHRSEPLPFGAELRDEKSALVGYVGQGGQVYARVENASGRLRALWGNKDEQQCFLNYTLPPEVIRNKGSELYEFSAECLSNQEG
ncbi:TPA: fimbria/pilus outer membrane usher protein [Citrobacter farmeri]|uniref:fimbria/pilus outer membrane usher protein n=1 Tax=Citrobacter farmeri TaxID=67824 RepID=UPI001C21BEC6|nr:fimbria/pilus outer membrane usher protein [Citrobacter farmeri]QXA96312.1 fimbrial biogenesis outer membrane usher protein [Citrobacter farmeri]